MRELKAQGFFKTVYLVFAKSKPFLLKMNQTSFLTHTRYILYTYDVYIFKIFNVSYLNLSLRTV